MFQRKNRKILIIVTLTAALLLAITSIALADDIVIDGDVLVPAPNISVTSCTAAIEFDGTTTIEYKGSEHFKAAGTINITYNPDSPITILGPATITLPSEWDKGDYLTFDVVTTVPAGISNGTFKVYITASGLNEDSDPYEITDFFNINVSCPSDTSKPIISADVSGTAGSNGWYTSDVKVIWNVSDPESGIASSDGCGETNLTLETTGTTLTCSATNGAGLSNSASVTIKLDKTGPNAILAVTAGTLGLNGWYTSDVTISTSGSDDISGPVTCSADQFQKTETAGTVFNGSCTNDAGLTTNAAPLTVKLDKTGPTAALSVTVGTAGTNGWYTSNVTVHTAGSDSISNLVTCSVDQYQTTETTGQEFNGSCTNDAGLTTDAAPLTVKLDKTGPSAALAVTAGTAGTNGWYISDVTVGTSGSDSISNPTTCTADQYQTSETSGTVFNGSCTNDAGLTTNATPLTVKLDKTSPTITWNGGPDAGGSYYFGFVPAAPTCTAADALSGPNGCSVTGYDNTVGSHTLTATAYDIAGNSKVETRKYTVLAWTLNGFFQPVDMTPEGGTVVYNVVKNGSTVPLKFKIFASVELTDIAYIKSLNYDQVTCYSDATTATIETVATGNTALRYDFTSGQFVYNWKTPNKAGNCYVVVLTTQDGSTLVAYFKLK
jgi:hypothetical protein